MFLSKNNSKDDIAVNLKTLNFEKTLIEDVEDSEEQMYVDEFNNLISSHASSVNSMPSSDNWVLPPKNSQDETLYINSFDIDGTKICSQFFSHEIALLFIYFFFNYMQLTYNINFKHHLD